MPLAPDERSLIDEALRSTNRRWIRNRAPPESAPAGELRVNRIVDGVFWTIYCLLGIRVVLALAGASPQKSFARVIEVVTDPLRAVFSGILPGPIGDGRYILAFPILLAILLYAVLHGLARAMLQRLARRRAGS